MGQVSGKIRNYSFEDMLALVVDGFTIRQGLGAGVRLYDTRGVLRNNVVRDNMSSAGLAYGAGVSVRTMNRASASPTWVPTNIGRHVRSNACTCHWC